MEFGAAEDEIKDQRLVLRILAFGINACHLNGVSYERALQTAKAKLQKSSAWPLAFLGV